MMFNFSSILINLQAVIAAHAARDRALTALLVAVWGRIARMGTRLERLVALWRAGKLPKPRPPRAAPVRDRAAVDRAKIRFPTSPGWLRRKLGHEVAAFGSQLRHMMTDAEARAFLAACPQAGRILRPLLRMLSADPVPEFVRRVVPALVEMAVPAGMVVAPACQILDG